MTKETMGELKEALIDALNDGIVNPVSWSKDKRAGGTHVAGQVFDIIEQFFASRPAPSEASGDVVEAITAAANVGYLTCAKTRHVSLGDKVRGEIMALAALTPAPQADVLREAQRSIEPETDSLVIAIEQAIAWFDEYAQSHAAKAQEAVKVDAIEAVARQIKSETNAQRAAYLRAALTESQTDAD